MDLQIVGEHRVADQIGDEAEARRRDHHRHDGEAVEPVGEVHRVAGADDDEAANNDEEPAEIEHQLLEERKRQRGRERTLAEAGPWRCRRAPRSRPRCRSRVRAGKAVVALLGDLQIIVVEADQAEAERDATARSRHRGWRDWPTAGSRPPCRTGSSARPWSACRPWSTMCDCGPSVRIGWPLPCRSRSWSMIDGPNMKTKTSAVIDRAAGAERDVAEHVEDRELVGQIDQPIEHTHQPCADASASCPAAREGREDDAFSALTMGPMREPSEPLTMTTSPARIARQHVRFERGGVLGIAAPALGGKRLPQRAHQRPAAEHQIDARWRSTGSSEAAMQRRPVGPSSSMSPSTAMRRPRGPIGAWPSKRQRRPIEAGLAL